MTDKLLNAASAVFTILCCILILFPLFMMISISLQTSSEVYARSVVYLPKAAQFINYLAAMQNGNWARYFLNSFFVSAVVVIVSLLINSMSGYVFARIPFKGSGALFLLILFGMMIPPQVTMIPVYTMLRGVPFAGGNDAYGGGGTGLINTYGGLIIPFIAGSFGVFLCRQYYIVFPGELDDAARIDGCGRFSTFVRIYLPLSGPLIASLGVLKFTGTWNEFTWPFIITGTDAMKTVQVALTRFRDESQIIWNQLMAATFLVSLPVYGLFAFLQKYFIAGILAGSIKA